MAGLSDRPGVPTRFPSGVTNVGADADMASLPINDPTLFCQFMKEFDEFATGSNGWTATSVGALGGLAVADAKNGILQVTTSAGDTGAGYFEWAPGETFTLQSGKALWLKTKFKADSAGDDIVNAAFFVGLHVSDTSPIDATHRMLIISPDTSGNILLVVDDNLTETSTTIGAVTADTYTEVAVYYDGASTIEVWQDGSKKISQEITNLPGAEPLTVGFGILNGEAEAKVFSIDYIHVLEDR
jgi:hypothetical protein